MTNDPNQNALPTIQPFPLGDYQTNCMIVTAGDPAPGARCWVVDCGYNPEPLLEALDDQQLVVERVILTHAHSDHIAGLNALINAHAAPIVLHELESAWLSDPMLNLSAAMGLTVTAPQASGFVQHGDTLELERCVFRVAHTPGHSPGSISLIHEPSKQAIVGDTLFSGSVGRTDLPGGDGATLAQSIREHLYTLDPETVCYPGHGPTTTIGRERVTSPFVQG